MLPGNESFIVLTVDEAQSIMRSNKEHIDLESVWSEEGELLFFADL